MIVGALTLHRLGTMDISGDAFCPVEGCFGMALTSVFIAGYPAGSVCRKHGAEWASLWREITEGSETLAAAA